ncbi:TPA: protein sphX [bacterium]|nr:protein sphX [bacterium]
MAVLIITALLMPEKEKLTKLIKIDGSSTVYPITEAVSEEFQKLKKGAIKVTVGISGTGGGFKKFLRGEVNIIGASRPISKKEIEDCLKNNIEYTELPIAYDGICVVVNPKNSWIDSLTVSELKKIWEPDAKENVLRWNDVDPKWPNEPINLYGPGVDSGTFDYFTEAIVGKSKASRSDYTSSEDDNVLVQGVAFDRNALGYFGLAYYEENKDKLKLVAIVNPDTNEAVYPSEETIIDGSYKPLSRPLFIYVNKNSIKKEEIKEFINFYLKNSPNLCREVGYLPIPEKTQKLVMKRFTEVKTGTVFEGEMQAGVKLEDLLKK